MNLFQYNDDSVISIQRNGTPEISPLASIQNDHVYSGSENDLILSQVYTTSFTCKYNMAAYPFDSQKCSMIFIMEVSHIGWISKGLRGLTYMTSAKIFGFLTHSLPCPHSDLTFTIHY